MVLLSSLLPVDHGKEERRKANKWRQWKQVQGKKTNGMERKKDHKGIQRDGQREWLMEA